MNKDNEAWSPKPLRLFLKTKNGLLPLVKGLKTEKKMQIKSIYEGNSEILWKYIIYLSYIRFMDTPSRFMNTWINISNR